MASSPSSRPRAAYFEEYNEDAHVTLPETRQSANIGHKRSKPEVVKPRVATTRPDEASDSGYSSQVGPGTSNESSLEPTADASKPVERQAAAPRTRASSPEKPIAHKPQIRKQTGLKGLMSRARGDTKGSQREVCKCKDCVQAPKALKQSSAKAPPVTMKPGKASPAPKVVTKQHPIAPPPRPATTKPPAVTVPPKPAQPRPIPTTTQSYRLPRPTSYHASTVPQYYMNLTPALVAPSYPPPAPAYFSQMHSQPTPQPTGYSLPAGYAAPPRPQIRQWTSEQPHVQQLGYPMPTPPIAEHPPSQPSLYVATAPAIQPRARRHSTQVQVQASPVKKEYASLGEDYYKMPPPPVPIPRPTSVAQQQGQRPLIRHSHTTNSGYVPLQRVSSKPEQQPQHHRQSLSSQPPTGQRSPVKTLPPQDRPASSRRLSTTSRPVAAAEQREATYELERKMARLNVASMESSKRDRRRMTYYGHETTRDLEHEVGAVEAYQAEVQRTAVKTPAPVPAPASRSTTPAANSKQHMPLTPDNLRLVRKKTGPQQSSDVGSRISDEMRSKRSSRLSTSSSHNNPTRPRLSTDARHRSAEKESISLSFDPTQEVNFDLGKGTQGRTISLRPSKGSAGQMEFTLGGSANPTSSKSRERGDDDRMSSMGGRSVPGERDRLRREKSKSRRSTKYYEYVDERGKVIKHIETAAAVSRSASRKPKKDSRRESDREGTRSRRSSRSGRDLG